MLTKAHFPQNPNATLPTLIHTGKSFTNTTAVIDYLAFISSIQVPPATSITTAVHDEKVDPNFASVASVSTLDFQPKYRTIVHLIPRYF